MTTRTQKELGLEACAGCDKLWESIYLEKGFGPCCLDVITQEKETEAERLIREYDGEDDEVFPPDD